MENKIHIPADYSGNVLHIIDFVEQELVKSNKCIDAQTFKAQALAILNYEECLKFIAQYADFTEWCKRKRRSPETFKLM